MPVTVNTKFFGWFNVPGSRVTAYDPGLETDCIICGRKLCAPYKTISFYVPNDVNSYFYRTHKACYEELSDEDVGNIEGSVIDQIPIS